MDTDGLGSRESEHYPSMTSHVCLQWAHCTRPVRLCVIFLCLTGHALALVHAQTRGGEGRPRWLLLLCTHIYSVFPSQTCLPADLSAWLGAVFPLS